MSTDDDATIGRYKQERRQAIADGTWEPWQPADPIVDHLNELLAHAPIRAVAAASGVSSQRIGQIAAGKATRVRTPVANALMAVTVDDVIARTERRLPWPSQRRIGALMAIGWTMADVSNHAGCSTAVINSIMNSKNRSYVPVETAEGIERAYRTLKDTPGASPIARKVAHSKDYPPPQAWTDIDLDDPDPLTLQRVRAQWKRIHRPTWNERLMDAREYLGYSPKGLAEVLGTTAQTVRSWESGTTKPKTGMRAKVAATLNSSQDELFKD